VSGPEEGQVEVLQKGHFTIGKPGEGVASVACRSQGFFLLHLGGGMHPMVNGAKVERGGALLNDGDLIEVGKHRVRISIESDS
jgi:predicted component of type VI protein secretion system